MEAGPPRGPGGARAGGLGVERIRRKTGPGPGTGTEAVGTRTPERCEKAVGRTEANTVVAAYWRWAWKTTAAAAVGAVGPGLAWEPGRWIYPYFRNTLCSCVLYSSFVLYSSSTLYGCILENVWRGCWQATRYCFFVVCRSWQLGYVIPVSDLVIYEKGVAVFRYLMLVLVDPGSGCSVQL